ncbi:MAG: DUF547 domain-containing protein [Cyanobacteriota bacterium]|nr:DUF547 domain-containing protein [Cyanobacteriota bacterium]
MKVNYLKNFLFFFPLLALLGASLEVSNSSTSARAATKTTSTSNIAQNFAPFNYDKYAIVLSQYVNDRGLVNYAELKQNRQNLDEFNAAIGAVSPAAYQSWTDNAKIAFLINAYNSLTLESIIDNYPTKSIRNIPGVWKIRKFNVAGQQITLDHIEHQILRKEFDQPKIHVALVCAANSCPFLRREPFTAEKLEAQLDDQSQTFLAQTNNFRIDRPNNRVYLSSIFKWFGEDFEPTYGQSENIPGLNNKETAVINYVNQYLSPEERQYLMQGGYDVKYSNYDWSLNE